MNKMLASVNSLNEALIVQAEGVDIIDLKQPALGALGALDVSLVQSIVHSSAINKPISATVGDLPMQADIIFKAVEAMAATGVDYVKIGFFPDSDWQPVIQKLSQLTQNGIQLIAVLFADQNPDISSIKYFSEAGFTGIMLDTMQKQQGSLVEVMSLSHIKNFVDSAKKHQLLCGLAGSLREKDIATLLPLSADYLGFRGALCQNHQRTATLNHQAVLDIKSALTYN